MAKITYLLGAGASYYACPILEKQAEMMITLAMRILGDDEYFRLVERNDKFNFIDKKFLDLSDDNKYKILWYIGYFGKKAQEYNTIDTYAKKLFLNNETKELRLLKMSVSVFFDLWENFYHKGFEFPDSNNYQKIDNRYKALFSVLLDNENGKIKLNNDFKFITWNYDLQLEETFGMFLGNNYNSDLNSINNLFKYKRQQEVNNLNDVFHLNGHRGFFTNVSTKSNYDELLLNITNNIDTYWSSISDLFKCTENGIADFDNYINYAWEHNPKNDFLDNVKNVIYTTDVLIIIGYSFPAFNRKIDQLIFNEIHPSKIKKIIYQDPNANKQIIENLFKKPELYKDKIEIINEDKSLKQFYLPNEYFISQEGNKSNSTSIRT